MCSFDTLPENSIIKYVPLYEKLNPGKSESQFYIFLNNKSAWIRNKEVKDFSKNPTHVTMDRMKFVIEAHEEEDFWKYYTGAIMQGKILYFTEQLTTIFRYFADFDIVQKGGITERNIEALTYCVQKSVKKFYSKYQNDELNVIVSISMYSIKPAHDDFPEMRKTGVHMHWPNIFVTKEMALDMRETIIVDLENLFGKRVHPNNDWSEVVDATVYMKAGGPGGGLRMMGSHKTENCKVCKGVIAKRNDPNKCQHCAGNGKLGIGRPYFALMVMKGDGKRDLQKEEMYRQDMYSLMIDTKLRTTYTEIPLLPKYKFPDGFPKFLNQKVLKATKVHKNHENATRNSLKNDNPEWDLILKYIRMYDKYKNVVLSSVTCNKAQTEYVIHLNGENSRFCNNINREHNSNRIYIIINKDGMFQRCHDNADKKTNEMKFGLCSEYKYNLNIKINALDLNNLLKKNNNVIGDNDSMMNFKVIEDSKLKRCYLLGDDESMIVFHKKWSDTVQDNEGQDIFIKDTNMYSLDSSALGTKHSKAIKSIFFQTESFNKTPTNQKKEIYYPTKSLGILQKNIFDILNEVLTLAVDLDLDTVVSSLNQSGFDGLYTLKMNIQRKQFIENINDLLVI